jgi:hypothetical protein
MSSAKRLIYAESKTYQVEDEPERRQLVSKALAWDLSLV